MQRRDGQRPRTRRADMLMPQSHLNTPQAEVSASFAYKQLAQRDFGRFCRGNVEQTVDR